MTTPDPADSTSSDAMALDVEPPFSFSEYAIEDYIVLVVFWLLAADVFAQFFSRFVLDDSIGWTEEMARYLLIAVGFLGGAMAVRRNSHIMMEFLYRYMSEPMGRLLAVFVDVVRLIFFGMLAWLTYELAARTNSYMTSVDIPKSVIYYVACAGFVLMTFRMVHRILQLWPQRFKASVSAPGKRTAANEEAAG
ncbi:TRAP transporter small permease [Rhodovibrio salinarum]|uniref:TRAP transporter small permease protein n=1 Tax=Rhodovibrio salinarum TaxID=1087 RepID=A0A934QKZ2_9PROT|nr:TRAP transporter small permease [Rhodovibrio salinarum]MBK1699113.1 TRAP transporter small permease [Rhodovibrio salinarum]